MPGCRSLQDVLNAGSALRINRDSIQAQGLVGCWQPTVIGSPPYDLISGRSIRGTFGSASSVLPFPMGLGMNFDGTDNSSFTDVGNLVAGTRTAEPLSIMFRSLQRTNPGEATYAGKGAYLNRGWRLYSRIVGDPSLSGFAFNTQGGVSSNQYNHLGVGSSPTVNVIQHMVFTVNGLVFSQFINGQLVASRSSLLTPSEYDCGSSSDDLKWGIDPFFTSITPNGILADCRIYNKDVGPAVAAAYFHPATRWDAYWVKRRSAPKGGAAGNSLISGSTTMTFTPAGTIRAKGVLSGNASMTFSPTATPQAKGALSGSSTFFFAPAGTIRAKGALAGSSTFQFLPTASAQAKGALSGSTTFSFAPAGTIQAKGALSGSVPFTFSPAGSIRAKGALSGSCTFTFTATCSPGGTSAISGTCSFGFTPTGSILGRFPLSGIASLAFSPTGALQGKGALSGASQSVWSPVATIQAKGALAGQVSFSFTVTGSMVTPYEVMPGVVVSEERMVLVYEDRVIIVQDGV